MVSWFYCNGSVVRQRILAAGMFDKGRWHLMVVRKQRKNQEGAIVTYTH
jgi:hypothetical protein